MKERRVGISEGAFYPASTFKKPCEIVEALRDNGAEVAELFPSYRALFLGQKAFESLVVPVTTIHQNWWADRRVENLQKFPSQEPRFKKIAISLGFPPYVLSTILERRMQRATGAHLVTHWPHFPPEAIRDDQRASIIQKRNELIGILPEKQVAEIHSTNILLNADELLLWYKRDIEKDRRLAITYPIDPRRQAHFNPESQHADLIRGLEPKVSLVYLKTGDLFDEQGKLVMSEDQIEQAIRSRDYSSPYAEKLRLLSEKVGSELNRPIDYILNVRESDYKGDFLAEFVEFTKGVVKF